MITGKQVSLLLAKLNAAGIYGSRNRLDFLFEAGLDVAERKNGDPDYESMSPNELDRALKALERR